MTTTTALWDAAFLKTHEASEREEALDAQTSADWQQALHQFARERSDVDGVFALCPVAKCRRARRCALDEPVCAKLLKTSLSWHVEQELIEDIYAEKQMARRDAAVEAAEHEEAPWL
jgi:hypothetical protein